MLVIMKKRLNKKNYFKKFFETKNVENKEAKVKDKRKADRKKFKSDELKYEECEDRTIVGVYKKSKNFGFVVPNDRTIGEDIYIPKKKSSGAKNNEIVIAKIDKQSAKDKKPEGRIVEVLGSMNEAGVDMLSLIKEYKLPNEFPEPVLEEARQVSQTLDRKNILQRVDLRGEEIFTIDGEDAKDLDDAVNVKKNDDGTYTLGVHIADVSFYVKSGSKLDKEAIKRGTSVYMMDRVIPMLPKELSNGICSLNENQDRFTISVIMKINKNGKVIESRIFKSVIKTTKRMNYHDVNDLFLWSDINEGKLKVEVVEKDLPEEIKSKNEDGNINTITLDEYKRIKDAANKYGKFMEHFVRMRELKDILKKRRDLNGSLNLNIPESKIILDKNGVAVEVKKYDYLESNEVIEQFMLTANETVAESFYYVQAPFIYRNHEIPDMEKIDELNKFLFGLGYKIRGIKKDDEQSVHPKAFAQVLNEVSGKEEEKVVSNLVLRTLKVAKYESENKGHFGIASKCYCHFTSPIRRYPDLFIHRVISSYLKHDYNINDELREKYSMEAAKYAESSSERERVAQKVERDAEKIKKAEYMQNKIGVQYDGVISGITQFGMFVELENTIEGLVRFDDMGNEYFDYDEQRKTLRGEKYNKIYKVGDKVQIEVKAADKTTRRIDFKLIDSKIEKNKNRI